MRLIATVAILGSSLAMIGTAAFADRRDAEDIDLSFSQTGAASWYGPGFHGKLTAAGERFDQNRMTAAHRTLPLGSEITVTNLENGRTIVVAINDRGPYAKGRVLDLSKEAARRLGMLDDGVAPVRIEATSDQLAKAAADD